MKISRYITLDGWREQYVLMPERVVGFTTGDPRVLGCNVLLDSGSILFLNGVSLQDAQEKLESWRRSNNEK